MCINELGHYSTGNSLFRATPSREPLPLGAIARSYRRQDGADATARFEKFLPARASLRPPIFLKFTTEKHGGILQLAPKRQTRTFSRFLYTDPRKIRRETTVGKINRNNGRRQLNWVTTVAWGMTTVAMGTATVASVAEKPWDYTA